MPENKTVDPFKPAQPRIPGVADPEEKEEKGHTENKGRASGITGLAASPQLAHPERTRALWVWITLAGALATGIFLFGYAWKAAPAPGTTSAVARDAEPAETAKPRPEFHNAASPDTKLPVGPGEIATTEEMAKAWSAKRFYFRDPTTLNPVPAMVVHLPGGTFWAFSLREPFGSCELEYVTDLKRLSAEYNFAASHPMVGDPCNKTVFDLTRYGNGPSGMVRGEIEQGPGWRPPTAIEVRVKGKEIVAARMEP